MIYEFVGQVDSNFPKVPDLLRGKINFFASTPLTEDECKLFEICLEDLCIILKKDKMENDLMKIFVCFTPFGHFAFNYIEGSQASYGQFAIYNMNEIRKLGAAQIAFVFTEELVHHFWKSEIETKVKLKVIEILQITEPSITQEYVQRWDMNWN